MNLQTQTINSGSHDMCRKTKSGSYAWYRLQIAQNVKVNMIAYNDPILQRGSHTYLQDATVKLHT
jgi:hypothetical protein